MCMIVVNNCSSLISCILKRSKKKRELNYFSDAFYFTESSRELQEAISENTRRLKGTMTHIMH